MESAAKGPIDVDVGLPAALPHTDKEHLPDICNLEWQKDGMPDTEFNRKYPPDAWGEEASPNARVWTMYRDQQDVSRNSMLAGWNKTLDVLLIFAGLFSAVLTAFLIESYKVLQPDYTQYVAELLYAAAVSHNRTGGAFPTLDTIVAPEHFVQTSAVQRWTNGLWFSSLVISLAVALLCILVKQWLDAYDLHVSAPAPSPRHWARRYTLYHRGLKKWGVSGLISFLPLLLHLSLFLFFGGLILFLRPLDGAISSSLLVMISCIVAFYVLSLAIPAWCVECPSYTPLLAQGLLALTRTISVLLYAIKPMDRQIPVVGLDVPAALSALVRRAEEWLLSTQLLASQQLARETIAISTCDSELDGYVLSALVRLPNETDRDVVNAACAAIGAVTSTRTMAIISRRVLPDVFENKINDCCLRIPAIETGFAITSHARLCRAYMAMLGRNANTSPWPFDWGTMHAPRILSSLGIDGLLMRIMDAHWQWTDIFRLSRQLQSLPLTGDRSLGFPLRSTCLDFLEYFSRRRDIDYPFWSCFLLVFCAGRFASADVQELVRALQCVETVLDGEFQITLPTGSTQECDYILAVADGLWLMLASSRRFGIDTLTAQIVAHQALACFEKVLPLHSAVKWARLSCLSTFIRSPIFGQVVGTGDRLARYIGRLEGFRILDRVSVPLEEYWECVANLLRLSWGCVPQPEEAGFLSSAVALFPVRRSDWYMWRRLSRGGPYATQDDWYEPALAAFLTGRSAIAAWTAASSPSNDDTSIVKLVKLACRISIVLCRRQNLCRPNDVFVEGLFSGSFLLARFRDHIPMEQDEHEMDADLLVLARHCLRLSRERFMAICTQLEETGGPGSALRARAIAFAQRIRDGSTPGGALSAACSAKCPCMLPGARAPAMPIGRTRWESFMARFQPGRTASPMTPNV